MLVIANLAGLIALIAVAGARLGRSAYELYPWSYASLVIGLVTAWLVFMFAGPYHAMLTNKLCWSATSFPGIRISWRTQAGSFLRLQLVDTLLTLVTCGLYRPFAVVRAYRYRLAHLSVTIDDVVGLALSPDRREVAGTAKLQGKRTSGVERLQRHWYAALLGLGLLAASAAVFAKWGMPALADRVLTTLSPAVDQRVGDEAESALGLNVYSAHSEQTVAQLHEVFRLVSPAKNRMPLRLVIRSMDSMPFTQPAAFALPNGAIVVSDDLVSHILQGQYDVDDTARATFAAFLAHEIGHIEGRHAMRSVLGGSVMALGSAPLFGDFGKVVADEPEVF